VINVGTMVCSNPLNDGGDDEVVTVRLLMLLAGGAGAGVRRKPWLVCGRIQVVAKNMTRTTVNVHARKFLRRPHMFDIIKKTGDVK